MLRARVEGRFDLVYQHQAIFWEVSFQEFSYGSLPAGPFSSNYWVPRASS